MEEKDFEQTLRDLVYRFLDTDEFDVLPLTQSGGTRRYYRIVASGKRYIATYVPDRCEGECFVELARVLKRAGADVPEVFAVADDSHAYIQEDLGDVDLFSVIKDKRACDYIDYIKETLLRLSRMQKIPESVWSSACLSRPFSRRQVMWDLNYFKYELLRPKEIVFDEERLEDDFERLSDRLLSIPEDFMGFMMRDCQSRNVMLTSYGPVFIDFQGGRKGPVLYDAVSLLWQARAGFSRDFRMGMLDFYSDAFCGGDDSRKHRMLSFLKDIVLFRTLQVLGAYGFRGLVQRKAHFLLSIPGGLANLRELIGEGALDDYPELKSCAIALTASGCIKGVDDKAGSLTVEVFSFSYKKGYPEDISGNGGGFMFDCRAMHNPGRYKEYISLTGRDQPVIDFLEERGEVEPFLRNAWSLTDPAIERYVSRGFSHLQIGFGCTGGQHRSVYCAEHTAEHIEKLFPEVVVRLIHREHP